MLPPRRAVSTTVGIRTVPCQESCTLHAAVRAGYSFVISALSSGGAGTEGKCFHMFSAPASKERQQNGSPSIPPGIRLHAEHGDPIRPGKETPLRRDDRRGVSFSLSGRGSSAPALTSRAGTPP